MASSIYLPFPASAHRHVSLSQLQVANHIIDNMVVDHISRRGKKSISHLDGLIDATSSRRDVSVMREVTQNRAVQLTSCWWHGPVTEHGGLLYCRGITTIRSCGSAALHSLERQTSHLHLHKTDLPLFAHGSCVISIPFICRLLPFFVPCV